MSFLDFDFKTNGLIYKEGETTITIIETFDMTTNNKYLFVSCLIEIKNQKQETYFIKDVLVFNTDGEIMFRFSKDNTNLDVNKIHVTSDDYVLLLLRDGVLIRYSPDASCKEILLDECSGLHIKTFTIGSEDDIFIVTKIHEVVIFDKDCKKIKAAMFISSYLKGEK